MTCNAVVSHLAKIVDGRSIQEVWDLHTAKMAEYGFDRLLYGFTRFRTSNSFGSPDDVLILSNHESEYLDRFIHQGLYHDAPMVKWAAANEGACSWRYIQDIAATRGLTDKEKLILDFNFRFDIRAGYSISFSDISVRAKGAIGLAGRPGLRQSDVDAIWHEHGAEILLINKVTHLRITSMPFASSRRPLTPRQREALEWVADGKTTQDIAEIMGLTQATVEKHLRLAREALDVDTTAQAVHKASYQNQIFIVS